LVAAFQGSDISTKDQRPKPPWLFTAGIQSVRAVATFAALSFFFSPVTSISELLSRQELAFRNRIR